MAATTARTTRTPRKRAASKRPPVALTGTVLGADDDDIEITAEPRLARKVTLVGRLYLVTSPKGSLAMKFAVRAKQAEDKPELIMDSVHEWIDNAFTNDDAAAVKERLDDKDDLLDIGHITQLMERMLAQASGNPTS